MLGTKKPPLLLALCAGALFGLSAAPARAGDVTVTPVEWYALPDFCRPAILGSIYIHRVPFELRGQGDVAYASAQADAAAILEMHRVLLIAQRDVERHAEIGRAHV